MVKRGDRRVRGRDRGHQRAVGAYSALIAAQEGKAEPDQTVIATARAAQSQLAKEREQLRSTDRQQITEVRSRYAQLAREVLASLG